MIARLKVGNPLLRADMDGNLELSFQVDKDSAYAAKSTVLSLKNNKKALNISLEFAKKKRTIDQNAMLWALLTELAKGRNGGRKGDISTEDVYYEMLNRYGIDTIVAVKEGAEKELLKAYKKVYVIDKYKQGKTVWTKCRCVVGSSNYTTVEFSNLIEGLLDEISIEGIENEETKFWENQWNLWREDERKRILQR